MKKFLCFVATLILAMTFLFAFAVPVYATDVVHPDDTTTIGATEVQEETGYNVEGEFLWTIVMVAIPFAFVYITHINSKSEESVRSLTNYISDNDKETREHFDNIKNDVDMLVKAHPELLKTEEYQTLMDNMIKTNTFLISATEHKDVINGIYRAEHSVKEKEFGEIKSFKVSGFKVVPYKTKKEFDKIKEVCSDISVKFNDLIYGGFVVLDKENQFVAHFEYAKEKRRDFVNISYAKSDIVDERLFVKLLSRLTDYAYEFFGGIYFFVEIEDASEKMVKKLKEYGYKKSVKLENTFYQDKNAELGVISLIAVE